MNVFIGGYLFMDDHGKDHTRMWVDRVLSVHKYLKWGPAPISGQVVEVQRSSIVQRMKEPIGWDTNGLLH